MKRITKFLFALSCMWVLPNALNAQTYCTPQFTDGCIYGDQIENFSTTGGSTNISNLASGCSPGSYQFFNTQTVTGLPGDTISFIVQSGSAYGQGHRIWIDWNGDGDFTDPGEDIWNSGTSGTTPYTGQFIIPVTAAPMTTRLRVRCNYAALPTDPCASQFYGEAEDYNITILPTAPCVNPPAQATASASDTLVCPGAPVQLSFTGVPFGSGQTYQWQTSSDNISWSNITGATMPFITINPTVGAYYRIEITCGVTTPSTSVWVNAVSSTFSGLYTINSALPSSGTNFNSFSDFINDVSCGSVTGPVVVEVAPNSGPYNEQLDFDGPISGVSATNTITFKGNGNTVEFNSSDGNKRATLMINSVKHLIFRDLTFDASGTGTYGVSAQLLSDDTEYITFKNCTFKSDINSTSFNYHGVIVGSTPTSPTAAAPSPSHVTIDSCVIEGGYYGLVFTSPSTAPFSSNNQVTNTLVTDFYLYGVYLMRQQDAIVERNEVTRVNRVSISTFYGIYLTGLCEGTLVSKNNLHGTSGPNAASTSYSAYPFYLSSAVGTASKPILITNNLGYDLWAPSTLYGLYLLGNADHVKFYHNSLHFGNPLSTSSTGTLRAIYASGTSTGLEFKNNILSVDAATTGQQHLVYFLGTASTIAFDNNAYFVNGISKSNVNFGFWGSNRATLADWQGITGQSFDANSNFGDPIYLDAPNGDLTPAGAVADGIGANLLSTVQDDYYGIARTTTPDAGAIEYTPLPCLPPNIVFGSVTGRNIAHNWTVGTDVDSVRIEWGPQGFQPGTGDSIYTTDTTYNIANYLGQQLATNTCYDVYFWSYCGGNQGMLRVGPFTYCTDCGVFNAPFTENFDGSTWRNGNGAADRGDIDACWTRNPVGSSGTAFAWYVHSGTTTSASTGPEQDVSGSGNYIYTEASYGSATDTALFVTPKISLTGLTRPAFSFYYHMYGQSIDFLAADVWSKGVWTNNVVLLQGEQQNSNGDAWKKEQVLLSNYLNDTIQIRWRARKGTSFYSDLAIDEVEVGDLGPCHNPSNLRFDTATSTTASFAWDSYNSQFNVEWGAPGFTPGSGLGIDSVQNVGNPYTVTGLNPGTVYHIYVRDACDPNSWIGPIEFFTLCNNTLSGNYTIGGPAGPNNFATLDSAYNTLRICGIGGPVVFELASGTFAKSMVFDGLIFGQSATNTVTFRGQGMNSTTISASGGDATIHFKGGSYFSFENLAITKTSGFTVWMSENARFISFDSVMIENSRTTTSTLDAALVATGASNSAANYANNANHISVTNSVIAGGYYAARFNGTSIAVRSHNIEVSNTLFEDYYGYGLYAYYMDTLDFVGNEFNKALATFGYPVYMVYADVYKINESFIDGTTYGIYISQGNSQATAPSTKSEISNNMITGGNYGIYFSTVRHTNIFHNSVWGITGAYYTFTSSTGLDIRNNIFQANTGYSFYSSVALDSTNNTVDYNLYYTGGTNLAYDGVIRSSLTDWTTASPFHNANSVNADPIFVSPTDLNVLGTAPNDVGDNSVGIAIDIYGNTRPAPGATVVDMGCIEFTPKQRDAVFVAFEEPKGGCGDSSTVVSVVVRNIGALDITSLPIQVQVSGDITTTLNSTYTGTISSLAFDTIVVGTFNTYTGGTVNLSCELQLLNDEDTSNDTGSIGGITFVPFEPQFYPPAEVCPTADSAMFAGLDIPSVSYGWYSSPTDTVPIHIGDTLMVPVSGQSTYYLGYESRNVVQQVGAGAQNTTSTTVTPYKTFYMDGRAQYLWRASELNALGIFGGNINSIAFDVVTADAAALNDFTIKIGSTPLNELTSFAPNSSMFTVFNQNYTTTSGWNVHTFTSPYFWNGTDNLIVEVCFDNSAWTGNSSVKSDITPFSSVYDGYADLSAGSGCTDALSIQGSRSERPSVQFNVSSDGCSDIKQAVTFNLKAAPQASLNGNLNHAPSMDVDLDASASQNGHVYIWNFGDGNFDTTNTPNYTHTYAQGGNFNISVIVVDTVCGGSDTANFFAEGVAIDNYALLLGATVFPNPSTGIFTLTMDLPSSQGLKIRIYDMLGRQIWSRDYGHVSSGSFVQEFNLNKAARGIYILEVTTTNGKFTQRVALE